MTPTRPTPLTPYTPYSYNVPISQQSAYNPPQSQQKIPSPLPVHPLTVETSPLTASAFAPYGTIISTPLSPNQNTIPYPPPQGALAANHGSALKYPSSLGPSNSYHLSPSGTPAKPAMSVISSFPRTLRSTSSPRTGLPTQVFDVRILERHPYTTQTVIPLAASPPHKGRGIIIVAPTLPPPPVSSSSGTPYFPQATSVSLASAYGPEGGMPDLRNLKAFMAEAGQGVMYGAGTWHAPVVIVGEGRADFVVSQWMSGREREDCQEVEIEEGICVNLGKKGDGESDGLWKRSRL